MALSPTTQSVTTRPSGAVSRICSQEADWSTIHTAPQTQDGNPVTDPGSLSSSAIVPYDPQGQATSLAIRLVYPSGATGITNPVIQLFGKSASGVWEHLPDVSGATEVTLAAAATDCVVRTGFKATQAKLFDLRANATALLAIRTAFAATGGTGAYIEAKAF